jgi:hypothetical protein
MVCCEIVDEVVLLWYEVVLLMKLLKVVLMLYIDGGGGVKDLKKGNGMLGFEQGRPYTSRGPEQIR